MLFHFDEAEKPLGAVIKVVGVGGAGCNAVNRMIEGGLSGVEFIAVNTDAQALMNSRADNKIQIGVELTRGLGAGGNPNKGLLSAEENEDAIRVALDGADMIFVTCGEGGGTGTGAAPIVAGISRDLGALTVGVVTTPFRMEGKRRATQAAKGIAFLRQYVDTLIVIPNERLLALVQESVTFVDALRIADGVLYQATKGIADLITIHGVINVDFADVRSVMHERGDALMGTGVQSGENRAKRAAEEAISSPLLEDVSISGARGVLVNVTGSETMTLIDTSEALKVIHDAAGDEANIILGAVVKPEMEDEIHVTVIATGFNGIEEIDRQDEEEDLIAKRLEAASVPLPSELEPARASANDRSQLLQPVGDKQIRTGRDLDREPRRRLPSLDLSIVPDPKVEMGREGSLDTPAFIRAGGGNATGTSGVRESDSENLEVPTFVRRQMD
ncbi:MAG: cell division protein FtsZ [Gemmatimonadetes bacterium]|nr:cell division protein FtsZ [Gemmatimonadota bacterium]